MYGFESRSYEEGYGEIEPVGTGRDAEPSLSVKRFMVERSSTRGVGMYYTVVQTTILRQFIQGFMAKVK